MGGDSAPEEIVKGAVFAARELGIPIKIVGIQSQIEDELKKYEDAASLPIDILHAEDVIGMEESPSVAIRKKKKSSIRIGINEIKDNKDTAFVSAGNTGAVLAAATLFLRTLEGIDRPAIGAFLPAPNKRMLLIDAGANVEVHANQLFQFGVMGEVFSRYVLEKELPVVGLLSIGEEESKGRDVTKDAFTYLNKSSVNFMGNIEAKEVYKGKADVIVCDGFTGNISLKISESIATFLMDELKAIFAGNWRGKLAYLLIKPFLSAFKKKIDYHEYGGAPLLGVNGTVVIAHGSSNHRSIMNAIKLASEFIKKDVNQHIKEEMEKNSEIKNTQKRGTGLWQNIKETLTTPNS